MLEGKDEIVSLILFLGQEKFIAGDRNRDVRIRELEFSTAPWTLPSPTL